jgi:hypothetical protein
MEEEYSNIWFALGVDGVMYCLGDCGDFECAEEIAAEYVGVGTVWIADETTARQWYACLSQVNPM